MRIDLDLVPLNANLPKVERTASGFTRPRLLLETPEKAAGHWSTTRTSPSPGHLGRRSSRPHMTHLESYRPCRQVRPSRRQQGSMRSNSPRGAGHRPLQERPRHRRHLLARHGLRQSGSILEHPQRLRLRALQPDRRRRTRPAYRSSGRSHLDRLGHPWQPDVGPCVFRAHCKPQLYARVLCAWDRLCTRAPEALRLRQDSEADLPPGSPPWPAAVWIVRIRQNL